LYLQICSLAFGSLSYHGKQLVIELKERPKDIDSFVSKTGTFVYNYLLAKMFLPSKLY